jgi:hypothetical protein
MEYLLQSIVVAAAITVAAPVSQVQAVVLNFTANLRCSLGVRCPVPENIRPPNRKYVRSI